MRSGMLGGSAMRHQALLIGLAMLIAFPALAADVPAVALIERSILFGNPSRSQARLSRDGKWLAWLAPRDGVMNLWAAPVSDPANGKPLTNERERPIRGYFWAADSSRLLYGNDRGGDENFLLYGVDVATAQQKTLTPFEKTTMRVVAVSDDVKDRILIALNNRDERWHDVYNLDLKTGQLTLVFENTGNYGAFVADNDLNVRFANRTREDGGVEYFRVTGNTVSETPVSSTSLDDSPTTFPAGFTHDGKTLYWVDSRGRDKAVLLAEDVATGTKTVLGASDRADITGSLRDPKSGRVQAFSENYLKNEWIALDPAIEGDLDFLKSRLNGEFAVTSRTYADDLWTVVSQNAPVTTYLYERGARKLTRLFVNQPELEHATLAEMHPLEIKTRDGLTQVSYLTLPPGSDADGNGRPDRPLPMVLFVHGGPWGRDVYGFNPTHQWLANRGYAVLSVNYRGSTGFGKAYIASGNLQWGLKMHDDLIDAVEWAVANGIAARDKVAIMGGSYGGYATLAGLAFTPDVFACGVDIVGPSNLNTLLASFPAYWEALRRQLYARMGDPNTEEGRKVLHDASPLFKADAIKRPLLIGQGANDPRVKQAESDQIVDAMKAKNIPVTYVLFPDEGHGFARPENNIAFNAVAEQFLQRCLGGRAEPIGAALAASTATVPHGAEFAPGVTDALAARRR
jgi:dipeptidyl aminopeptidase/acylaminoacyl peptidase